MGPGGPLSPSCPEHLQWTPQHVLSAMLSCRETQTAQQKVLETWQSPSTLSPAWLQVHAVTPVPSITLVQQHFGVSPPGNSHGSVRKRCVFVDRLSCVVRETKSTLSFLNGCQRKEFKWEPTGAESHREHLVGGQSPELCLSLKRSIPSRKKQIQAVE